MVVVENRRQFLILLLERLNAAPDPMGSLGHNLEMIRACVPRIEEVCCEVVEEVVETPLRLGIKSGWEQAWQGHVEHRTDAL